MYRSPVLRIFFERKALAMNPELWAKIIEFAITQITKCLEENTPEEKIRRAIRRPNGVQAIRLERFIRQGSEMGLLEWRKQRGSILGEVHEALGAATDDDIDELLCQAGMNREQLE
jgi:hypothetical protein